MSLRVSSRNEKKPKVDYNFDPIGDEDVMKKTRKRKSNIKANKKDTDVSSPVVKKGRGRPKRVTKDAVENADDKDLSKPTNEKTSSKSEDEVKPDNEVVSSKVDNDNETKDAADPSVDSGTESSPAKEDKVTENDVEPENTSKSVEKKDSTISDDEKAIAIAVGA